MEASKDPALDDLSKEELVKRCKKFLLIAQKAKQAKDELSVELKACKENENTLKVQVNELVEKLATKDSIHQSIIEKSKKDLDILEKNVKSKDEENIALKSAFTNLNNKVSEYEILNSNSKEKLNDACLINEQLTKELKTAKNNCVELSEKLKNVESKYSLVEGKLVEFQDKYTEEKQKHSKLEARLLKLEEKSEKSSSERSESRDGLHTVIEAQDLEAACQKMDEAIESNEKNKNKVQELLKEVNMLKEKLVFSQNSQSNRDKILDSWIDKCADLQTICSKAINEYKQIDGKSNSQLEAFNSEDLLLELKEEKEKSNHFSRKIEDLSLINNNLNEKINNLTLELEQCYVKVSKYEEEKINDTSLIKNLKEEFSDINKNLNEKIQNLTLMLELSNANMFKYEEEKLINIKSIEELNNEIHNLKTIQNSIGSEETNLKSELEQCFKKLASYEEEKLENTKLIKNLNKEVCDKSVRDKEFVELSQKTKNLEEEKIKYINLIESSKKEISSLKSVRNLHEMEDVKKSQEVIENLNEQLKTLQNENLFADNKFVELQAKLIESTQVSENLELLVRQRCEEYGDYKVKIEAYDRLLPEFHRLGKDVSNMNCVVKKMREDANLELNNVKQEQQKTYSKIGKVLGEFLTQLDERNSELLCEMNTMNGVLKERGELISKLEESQDRERAEVSENESKIKKLNEKLNNILEEASSLRKELGTRDKTIHDLEDDIWKLRNPEGATDTMSTSTISRVDESQRMADIEESFEERYTKVKTFAIKLKKKVVELQSQLEKEHVKLVGERAENQTKLSSFNAQAEAMNLLQGNYDALNDKYDKERREANELRKSLNKSRAEGVTLVQTLNEVKSAAKLEDAKYEIIKKELSDQIKALKKAIDVEKAKGKEWAVEKGKWEQERKALEKKLEAEKEKHQAMVTRLEEERLKQKKQSLLSLEMADCERSVTELSRKLDAKQAQIETLTASLATQRELSGTLQGAVSDLENRVASEQTTADGAKTRELAVQNEVLALRTELVNKAARIEEVERLAQNRSLELDALVLESSKTTAEFAKLEEKLRLAQESARTEILHREDKLNQLKELQERKELELNELREEFEGYKVRAQNVLRQSQKGGPGRHQDIEEEVIQLRASNQTLRTKLEDTSKKLQQLTDDHTAIIDEKTRLSKKAQELQSDIIQLNKTNAELQIAEQRTRESGDENCRLLKVQQETLAQCYKKEIEDLETKYAAELENAKVAQHQAETTLQLHVGRQVSPAHRRQPSTGNADLTHKRQASGGTADTTHRRQPSTGFVPVKTERETLDVFMLEREACEGSESVDSSSPRVVPLEQLLAPQSSIVPSVDVSQLIDKLEKGESRIQHLTNLLSDAESDAARLQQLNQVLKEEIRRKERNVAREEHANNLEYLKNVVVKFATLPRGDERLRLVPVLNTILKLSREEEQRLCAASRTDGGPAGWGTYLGGVTGMWANNQ